MHPEHNILEKPLLHGQLKSTTKWLVRFYSYFSKN